MLFLLNGWLKTTLPIPTTLDPQQVMTNRSAQLALVNMAVSVFSVRRFKRMVWHAWFGRLAFIQAMVHASWQLQQLSFLTVHLSGLVMFSALVILIMGSHPLVRALSYRLFRVTHLVAFLLLVLMGCLHDRLFLVFYGAVGLFWLTDQWGRSFRTEQVRLEALPGNIVRILKGKHTRALYDGLPEKKVVARLSKPLGYRSVEFGDFETVVLVAEGVGITPWILLFQCLQEKQHNVKTLCLLWSIHTIETWYAFERELEAWNTMPLDLSIQVYITGPENERIPHPLPSVQFHYGIQPNYNDAFLALDSNRLTVLGICAHTSTMVTTNNIALTYGWSIRKERFEL
ncbi:hypothetical protein EDC96DRAFT_450598 [Choanephora cucurbitarum]|nr:hypothetical protein EDC96DRAFT_450598 [Choanephora cucurbitarum]